MGSINGARAAAGALAVACVLLVCGSPADAQRAKTPARHALTYEQAFGTAAYGGRDQEPVLADLPTATQWVDAGHYIETRREPDGRRRVYMVAAAEGTSTPLWPYEPGGLTAPGAAFRIAERNNDLFRVDRDGTTRQLTASPAAEEDHPRLSPDGTRLAYVRSNDLFVLDLASGLERQLTADGSDTILNGTPSWIYMEEILGRGSNAFWWSPDGTRLAFMRFDDSPVPIFPIFHADGQHGTLEKTRYPKPGDPNPYVRIGVVSIADGKTAWMDFDEKADQYLAFPHWAADGKTLYVQRLNRGQDDLQLLACDPATGKWQPVHEEKQASWVDWYEDLETLADGSVLFLSDVSGWKHLYRLPKGGQPQALTSGAWRVQQLLGVDERNGWVYLSGRPTKSWDAQVLRVKLTGGAPEIVTKDPGVHRATLSPDGAWFVDSVSTLDRPSKMTVRRGDGTAVRDIGDAASAPAFASIAWGQVELFTIPSEDGTFQLPAYWIKPADFSPSKRYPVIFAIYGGPDAGTVNDSWPGLAAHYWAQRGVITISVDHRGGGAFGKTGTALLHRNLGKWEMTDLMTAAAWLRAKPFIQADKIGISGSSYGGYTTAMALTFGAGAFNYGIAGSSVTDWSLYDSVYTERYMDSPSENPEGYKAGAVLTWADRYKGGLRLTHGTIDDNVHMQNTIQVVDWLTTHDKRFELMLYPDSRHGIQISQRAHLAREAHDFWVRNLLNGRLPDVVVATETRKTQKPANETRDEKRKEKDRTNP